MKQTKATIIICLLMSAVMLVSASCAISAKADELSAGYTRKATETGEITDDFKTKVADFSFRLFKGVLTKDNESELVSPLSAIVALAMVTNGADGNTMAQLEAAFGMDIDALNKALYAYTSSLYSATDCKLNLANSIWFRDEKGRLEVEKSFLQTNADWYGAQAFAAPFDNSTIKAINEWCAKHTDNMIKDMVEEIDPDNIMFLFNALVFDAKWAEEFEESEIHDSQFNNYGGGKSTVKMLPSTEKTFIDGDGFKGFAKDYKDGKYSFVALLPDEGKDIYEFIGTLDGEGWMGIWNSRSKNTDVGIKMPQFSYELKMNLNDTLKGMGIVDMFSSGSADFSKLGRSSRGNIYCSSVDQKVFIEVSRTGTRAAAVTQVTMSDECAEIPSEIMVVLDRPFVYALVDNSTGLPFFVGAVTHMK